MGDDGTEVGLSGAPLSLRPAPGAEEPFADGEPDAEPYPACI
jgi:hypothetical protein